MRCAPINGSSSRDSGRMLHLPADAQQVRVVAGHANDVALRDGVGLDQEVAIRDPAGEGAQALSGHRAAE